MIGVALFIIAALFIVFVEGIRIAESRGYKSAKRLSRSREGWEITENGNKESIWMLGETVIPIPTMADILARYSVGNSMSLKEVRSNKSYQSNIDLNEIDLLNNQSEEFEMPGRLSEIELPEFLK